jgi:hypothetical protein
MQNSRRPFSVSYYTSIIPYDVVPVVVFFEVCIFAIKGFAVS